MCKCWFLKKILFKARLQNCKKRFLASSCPSIRLYGKTRHPQDGFHVIWYFQNFSKICRGIQVSLKSDKNNEYFTWRSIYILIINFDVLLTVHLNLFILVINQLDAQNFLFYNKFISCLYMFWAPCAHRQEVKIVLYSFLYHHIYRCDDTRGCIIQFWLPDVEHMVLETCRGMK